MHCTPGQTMLSTYLSRDLMIPEYSSGGRFEALPQKTDQNHGTRVDMQRPDTETTVLAQCAMHADEILSFVCYVLFYLISEWRLAFTEATSAEIRKL